MKYRIPSLFFCVLLSVLSVRAELPTAQEVSSQMKIGWNLGNTLEAICGEEAWGGAKTTQMLIDTVRACGFNAIRLPCAWDCHANDGIIDPDWMARVKEVVDYCMLNDMYVILNIHWDNGWLENHVTADYQESVNAKQAIYWTQIAEVFKDYDEHLLFAGANEPNVEDASGMAVLMTYHQTFIDTVRASGGNNGSRVLIVQGPSTDIEKTNNLMNSLPQDTIADRLIVEVHYYTPYQFTLMNEDASWGRMFYYWGKGNHSVMDVTRNSSWGEEAEMDRLLGLMKTKFIDKGIPVIIGEFGAYKRDLASPSDAALNAASVEYFYRYFVNSAVTKGMIPFCWDINKGLFDRATGAVLDRGVMDAMLLGAGIKTADIVKISNIATGLFVDAVSGETEGSNAVQFNSSASETQQWSVLKSGNCYVKIQNSVSGLYLDGADTATTGSTVALMTENGTQSQQWFELEFDGFVKFRNCANGLYLDGLNGVDGSSLGLMEKNTGLSQRWYLQTPVETVETGA